MKDRYEVKYDIPERILYMALESVLYDEDQANNLIQSMIEDDLKRKKAKEAEKAKEKEKKYVYIFGVCSSEFRFSSLLFLNLGNLRNRPVKPSTRSVNLDILLRNTNRKRRVTARRAGRAALVWMKSILLFRRKSRGVKCHFP